ncbi:MAG: stage II sporulation protein R [Oscillospiraceae bacterium]|nr:stage II sporulation protein R [Oscillospiraceae bacterium]
MKKLLKRAFLCFLAVCVVYAGALVLDRQKLKNELVRLHVVAASDSEEDQTIKLQVRDAVLESLQAGLADVTDIGEAKAYIQSQLPKLESAANEVLVAAGCGDVAAVSLQVEEFAARVYDTFSLPAGLYDSLRVTIGEGEGRNWWCVTFPTLCMPATTEGFEAVAAGAGFSDDLTGTLTGEYEVRFYLLDLLGQLENFLHRQ